MSMEMVGLRSNCEIINFFNQTLRVVVKFNIRKIGLHSFDVKIYCVKDAQITSLLKCLQCLRPLLVLRLVVSLLCLQLKRY